MRFVPRRLVPVVACASFLLACGSRTDLPDGPALAGSGASTFGVGDGGGSIMPLPPAPSATETSLPPVPAPPPGPPPSDCPTPNATLVYLVARDATLMSYAPPSGALRVIGRLACPAAATATPNSMAVDRAGTAYVGYSDGHLFRVSTATAACQATTFVPGQRGFQPTFGMGFASNADGTGETLYIAENGTAPDAGSTASRLAIIDTFTFGLTIVGTFAPSIVNPELTGTGAGGLYAFSSADTSDSILSQIDKTTAHITAQTSLRGLAQGMGWAFAFWGGNFYTFTGATDSASIISRVSPADGSVTTLGQTPELIVGAGVSTCAPQ